MSGAFFGSSLRSETTAITPLWATNDLDVALILLGSCSFTIYGGGQVMNLLFVAIYDFKPMTGGISEYTHRIAEQLHILGFGIHVVAGHDRDTEDFDQAAPYNIIRVRRRKQTLRNSVRFLRYLHKVGRQSGIDCIICNCILHNGFICSIAAKLLKIPYVVFTYGTELSLSQNARFVNLRTGCTLRSADLVLSCSSYTAAIAQKNFFIQRSKAMIVNPGLPEAYMEDVKSDLNTCCYHPSAAQFASRRIILTVGRLVERKGCDTVLMALPTILRSASDALYVIAGDGPYRDTLIALSRELEIEDHVIFLGQIDDIFKEFLYDRATVFVMPNRNLTNGDFEGFGIVFLEAGLHGLPVIGGRRGGPTDAVLDNETGFLVAPEDPAGLAATVLRCLNDNALSEVLGNNARQRILCEFSWSNRISGFRAYLDSVQDSR